MAARRTGNVFTDGGKAALELRAQWILDRWDVKPSLKYQEMLAEVRAAFKIGKTYGEQSIKRAYAILHEWVNSPEMTNRIASRYFALSEKAERKGNDHAAIRAMDSLRRHLGVGAPDRFEHRVVDEPDDGVEPDMSDEELMRLARKLDPKRSPRPKDG